MVEREPASSRLLFLQLLSFACAAILIPNLILSSHLSH